MSLTMSSPVAPAIDAGYNGDLTDLHGELLDKFIVAEENSLDEHFSAERARAFVEGDQWTSAEIAVLRSRGQPVVWNNIIGRKVDLLRGLERRGRSDPKAYPRTPSEDNRADAATQVLRYIADDTRYDVIRSAVFSNMLVEGVGGCEVIVEPDTDGGYRVVINHIPYERIFWDPHSLHAGFTDANYLGMVIWKDRDDALDDYPGCDDILDATFDAGRGQTYDDKPHFMWSDRARKRVRVVQIWWKRRQDWWVATLTKGGFLEQPMRSPYIDRRGVASCPLILRSARVGRNNNRFGVVKDMIPLQESANKRESKLLHSLSVNQLVMDHGAVDDEDKARNESRKPDGVIVKNRGFEFEIRKDTAEIQGQFELLKYTIEQLNVTGPNAAMSGKDPREQSGRAIIAQQAGGQMEHEPIADELRQHTHKVFEAAWQRAKQFWTQEKTLRVTDDSTKVQFIALNRKVSLAEELADLSRSDPARAQQIGQQLQLQPGDPRLQMVVRIENNLDDMDVEVTVEEGPDVPTMQAEQFAMIMQLPEPILTQLGPEFIIQASALRNKDQLLKLLEAHQQAQAADMQQAKTAAMAMQQAKIDDTNASAADKKAQAVQRMHEIAADHAGAPGEAALQDAQTAGARTQVLERMHGIASDHADMMSQPVMPGVGVVPPAMNPLLPPVPAPGLT